MKKILQIVPTRKACILGLIYLALELLVIPIPLALINEQLPTPLSEGRLNGVFFLLNFVVVTWIFRHLLLAAWNRFRKSFGSTLWTAIRGYLGYMAGSFVVAMIILILDPNFANVNDSNISAMAAEDFEIIAFCTIILVPVTEELLFRGIFFGGLYNKSPLAAYACSTLLFSAVHVIGYIGMYPPKTLLLCLLQYLPAGLALGWAYKKADNIIASVLMHTFVNALGILAMR